MRIKFEAILAYNSRYWEISAVLTINFLGLSHRSRNRRTRLWCYLIPYGSRVKPWLGIFHRCFFLLAWGGSANRYNLVSRSYTGLYRACLNPLANLIIPNISSRMLHSSTCFHVRPVGIENQTATYPVISMCIKKDREMKKKKSQIQSPICVWQYDGNTRTRRTNDHRTSL